MPHITEQKSLSLTRIVEPCPHCKGPIFAHEVAATETTWSHLKYKCDQCSTEWVHGGLVQSSNGFISDSRAEWLSKPEEDPDVSAEVLELAKKLKAAADYCSTEPYRENLYFHAQVAETLLKRKDVLPVTVFTADQESEFKDYLQDLNYEHGIDHVMVRDSRGTDHMLHCTDPDGDWWIQLIGNPEDYNDDAALLSNLAFPITVINRAS